MIKLVFPSKDNLTFRNGFIRLSAFSSEWDEKAEEAQTDKLSERLKNTLRVRAKEYEPGGFGAQHAEAFINNTLKNLRVLRGNMQPEMKFVAILPTPLEVSSDITVRWDSVNSAFIDAFYGHFDKAQSNDGLNFATQMFQKIADKTPETMDTVKNIASFASHAAAGVNALTKSGNTLMALGGGDWQVSKAVLNSPAMADIVNPSKLNKLMLGANSSKSILALNNEARALNGSRQIIFDPGYWQAFQGVDPREFTLSWEIIPESHQDAMIGLELCARLREFSLPQSVSGVELLSPCYWQIDWSSKYMQAQTLYSHLVIRDVRVNYADSGEWHVSGTPKKFKITISFVEAKAPTADIFKQDIKLSMYQKEVVMANIMNSD